MSKNIGEISQVIGPVIDVTFDQEGTTLPNILDALEIKRENVKPWLLNVSNT